MYFLKISKKIDQNIFFSIKKYYENYGHNEVEKHFNISNDQLMNLYQQMDVGGPYDTFDEMYLNYNKEVGTDRKIKISKEEYKNTILLLLSYYKNIINF